MKTFAGRKLGRKPGHREAMLRNMAASLFQNEKIKTTLPKAREVARFTEKIITVAKQQNLTAQRSVSRHIHQPDIRKKLFEVLVPRYQSANRNSGYTQIIRIGSRTGDAAEMALIQLLP